VTRNNAESIHIAAIIEKVQQAIVHTQGLGSLPVKQATLTLKQLDQKMVGVGLSGTILSIAAAIEGKHQESESNSLQLTFSPPPARPEMLAQRWNPEEDVAEAIQTINAVKQSLATAQNGALGFQVTGAQLELNFVVTNDGTINIVWEGEYHREVTNTLVLTF
jgi:hypothetical protein